MIFLRFGLIIVLCTLSLCSADLPPNYKSLSAKEKQALQWKKIEDSKYEFDHLPTAFPAPGSNLTLLSLAEHLSVTLTLDSDEMPGTRRRMTISPFASVCKVVFRTFKNSTSNFTGLFRTGGIGIIRLALDGVLLNHTENFSPSVAIKIYIDGDWSHNLLLVKDPIIGQIHDKNFFRDTVSNIFEIDHSRTDLQPKKIASFLPIQLGFEAAVRSLPGDALDRPKHTMNLGMYESASVNSDGTKITKVIAPWEASFVPNPKLSINQTLFGRDFRQNIHDVIEVGTVIYTAYGRRMENSTEAELIGEVMADSKCIPSQYGDEIIFFRHPRMQWRP